MTKKRKKTEPCKISGRPGGLCSLLGEHLDTKEFRRMQNLKI